MNNHQSTKAEIDSRDEKFTITVNLGRDLLARKHYRSQEVTSWTTHVSLTICQLCTTILNTNFMNSKIKLITEVSV